MKSALYLTTCLTILAFTAPAFATSANGTPSGSSFGSGPSPQTSGATGGTSAGGSASGSSFGSGTIGTDRINSDDDSDGVQDQQDSDPDDSTQGGLEDVDTDDDGVSDARDPTPTIPDGDATNDGSNIDGTTDTDGSIGTTGNDEAGNADTDDSNSNTNGFTLKTETNLPNPNNPDPRLNNGTIEDDAEARD